VAAIYGVTIVRNRALVASLPRTTQLRGPFTAWPIHCAAGALRGRGTARQGIAEATRIAKLWDKNCFLLSIHIAFRGDPDQKNPASAFDGFPIPLNGWMYRFFSLERRQFLHLTFTADGRCDVATRSAIDYLDSQPLATEFVDGAEPDAPRLVRVLPAQLSAGSGCGGRLGAWPLAKYTP
jgi:hypothetical protein